MTHRSDPQFTIPTNDSMTQYLDHDNARIGSNNYEWSLMVGLEILNTRKCSIGLVAEMVQLNEVKKYTKEAK